MIRQTIALCSLIGLMGLYTNSYAEGAPALQGFGVRSCDYLALSEQRWEKGEDEGALAYLRLQEWMAGFVSALSLATGNDVTKGAGTEGMVRQVVEFCRRAENRDQDVFSATMSLIQERSAIR